MSNEPNWDNLLSGIDFSLPTGNGPPDLEINQPEEEKNSKMAGRKVFVQKIITEIWVYTDVEGKLFGHQGIQDIVIVGEMDYDDALKMIGERKSKKRKNG